MKKILVTLFIIISVGVGFYLVEPTLSDDVVDEAIAVNIPVDEQLEPESVSTADDQDTELFTETDSQPTEKTSIDSSLIHQGTFTGNKSYRASGEVYISGQDLSLVNLDSTNVPDGRVYVSSDLEANEFIDLGALKGNQGNQNYRLPQEYDREQYPYVLIWCRAFSSLVGYSEIK